MNKLLYLAILLFTVHTYSQQYYSTFSIPKEFTAYSNSVLMDELVEIDVTNEKSMKVKTHRVVAVLNKLGDNNVGAYVFYDVYNRVKNLEAYVYDASGNKIEHFRKNDFKDISRGDGISIYNDDRVLYLDYTPTTYPYIVEFNSEVVSGDSAFINSWYPVGGYARSTLKSVAKVKYNSANKLKYKAENIDAYNIEITEAENEIICTATNINTIRPEENSPGFYNIAPKVRFALNQFYLKGTRGYGKNWAEFGSWMDTALLANMDKLPEATVAQMKSLVADETTNEGKARKIYQYLQDKVRYISIQIGIGGWKPMPATEVDKLSYGDCKALTNYTKALLESVGVPAYYTIIYAGDDEKNIEQDFTAIQGNHAILGIPDGDEITWLECTDQDKPYGYMGNFTDDRDVLIVTPEGGKIVHTKTYSLEDNTQDNSATVVLTANGSISADFKSVSKGLQYDDKYLLPKEKQEDIERYYKKKWKYLNGLFISDIEFENNREEIVFTEKAKLNVSQYANAVGDDFLFCANIFNQSQYIPPRITDRKQPLYLALSYMDTDSVEVELPENFSVEALPEEKLIETKFGSYRISFTQLSENKIAYRRELKIYKGTYPSDEYKNYRDFRRTIARLDKMKILLKQNVQ